MKTSSITIKMLIVLAVIVAVLPAALPSVALGAETAIKIADIPGVTVPVTGETPVTAITETEQYTGSVTWIPNHAAFLGDVSYIATITLTQKAGFTLTGVGANFFTVAGATVVTNTVNNGRVTAIFPKTAPATIDIDDIPGVTAPVTHATPVRAIETAQYTGMVTWLPNHATFQTGIVYTATITLTPKEGFTLTGVLANFFIVAGATATNTAGLGVVTAVFPATPLATVNIPDILGIAAPVTHATPVTTITPTAQYTGTVSWTPAHSPFRAATVYTATITLTPRAGFTFSGVSANFFRLAGANVVTNTVNTGIVTAVFPAAPQATVNIPDILGVTAPVIGATPVTSITPTAQYTGTVTWLPAHSPFRAATLYTATITLTPRAGFTFSGVSANFFRVAGATPVTNPAGSGVITAVFPIPTAINIRPIPGVTAPVTGATPVAAITETAQYIGSVSWLPTHSVFQTGTVYTATITIVPKMNFTLTGVTANFFTVAGATTATNPVGSGVVTAVFPAAPPATINIPDILGVTAPVTRATPVTEITPSEQYTGTITWLPADTTFQNGVSYRAAITLTPRAGFRLTGVPANFFRVAGATATNTAGLGVVTAVFPATTAAINIASITGVTAPATDALPVTAITETTQYTGSVSWSPVHSTFRTGTIYTATITLTPKAGFSLTQLPANFFRVSGATLVMNAVGSGIVTAIFPATIDMFAEQSVVAGIPTVVRFPGVAQVTVPANAFIGIAPRITARILTDAVIRPLLPRDVSAGPVPVSNVIQITLAGGRLTAPAQVILNYNASLVPAGQVPGVFVHNERTKRWIYIGGQIGDGTVTVSIDGFSKYAVFATRPLPALTDTVDHWGRNSIVTLAGMGIVSGLPGGNFKPNEQITRGEAVSMLIRALGLNHQDAAADRFGDAAGFGWARGAIGAAVSAGLIGGYDDGTFGAERHITRAEIAAILQRIINNDLVAVVIYDPIAFADAHAIPGWAREAIRTSGMTGLIRGLPDGTFRPGNNTTRAEMAAILYRLIAQR